MLFRARSWAESPGGPELVDFLAPGPARGDAVKAFCVGVLGPRPPAGVCALGVLALACGAEGAYVEVAFSALFS